MNIEKKEISYNGSFNLTSKVRSFISKISNDIFFIQERVWKNSEIFDIYKIRTMEDWADANIPLDVINWNKSQNDIRIIARRAWMRKTWFDELPQIINILKWDMAVFWSRPISKLLYDNLSDTQKERRAKYKPGVFGWYAFAYKWKRFSKRNDWQNQDIYLKLRSIKEKEWKWNMFKYNTYILIENIKSLLKWVNR